MPAATYEAVPEKRLLVACARTQMTAAAAQQIREIILGPLDWDYLLRAAAENSVLPLLALHLPVVAPNACSPEQFARLKAAARAAAIRSLQLSAELIRVVNALRAESVLALPYKGPVIAVQAYGDLALREFEDLDIIVPQRDMARANDVLLALKYSPKFPWIFGQPAIVPGEYNYYDRERRIIVELHTELTLRHFPVVPNLEEMSTRPENVLISGHAVPTFGPEDTLVLLCVHGSKDFWERLSWIADVSEFIQREKPLDWPRALARAEDMRATRMLNLGLALASRLLNAPLSSEVSARVDADATALGLAKEIESRLLAKKVSPRNVTQSFRYRRRMVPGALGSWRYGLRLATAPAEEDWNMAPLPLALAPLYAVLRPFRLFRKYGVSGEKTRG